MRGVDRREVLDKVQKKIQGRTEAEVTVESVEE